MKRTRPPRSGMHLGWLLYGVTLGLVAAVILTALLTSAGGADAGGGRVAPPSSVSRASAFAPDQNRIVSDGIDPAPEF